MLKNKYGIDMKKYFAAVMLVLAGVSDANAISIAVKTVRDIWYDASKSGSMGSSGDFVIDGKTSRANADWSRGTYSDEGAVVALVARKIVEHGAEFCPIQIQCANKAHNRDSWTLYHEPTGFNEDKCVWLCEGDYEGVNCTPVDKSTPSCDPKSLARDKSDGRFSSVKLRTSGDRVKNIEGEVHGISSWYDSSKDERDIIVGITKRLEHGAFADAVLVMCGHKASASESWIADTLNTLGSKRKLLCAIGYQPNADNTNCVPRNADTCANATKKFCSGFSLSEYNGSIHTLKQVAENGGKCWKYFCKESFTAYASAETRSSCVPCGPKDGADTNTGVCKTCNVGQIFKSDSNSCVTAEGYKKDQLRYGKDGQRKTKLVDECWTMGEPEEYKSCVIEGAPAKSTSTTDGADTDASRAARRPIRR